ncbi:acyl-CoA thioesterase [Kaustia mangrovi]|uniref:Acyl-CoA thioesterase n=1 Tax=Kaustia mangrovi TaxID=2593653 RepID=A0A7S8HC04_9HYPH|nr:thioesterase family protein [Kaustia mangrovi]QPC43125.1 acyl-CoA thioesterase [Kaustia mangrovi]
MGPVADTEFVHAIRVTWADCDPALIAYTGRIPCFALDAIDAWWAHHVGYDWYRLNLDRGVGTPFVHMSLDFRAPVTPRHTLHCACAPTRLGTSSIEFRVTGRQDGHVCFEGRFVCVFVEAETFRKRQAPADLRAIIEGRLANPVDQ